MATIEPRLIHLLNESQSPHLPHSSLPPLQDLDSAYSNSSSVRPLPLEPDAGQRAGDGSGGPGLKLAGKSSFTGVYRTTAQQDDPLPLSAPASTKPTARKDDGYPPAERTNSLRMILDNDVDMYETSSSSHHPLRKLRDEHTESSEDLSSKKRNHALTGKEDFPQLPHPLKKQKSSNTVQMPPIINGLHEPPPNAAIFPPISSGSFNDPDPIQRGYLREFPGRPDDSPVAVSPISAPPDGGDKAPGPAAGAKAKRRAAKPRRKWSDEETKHLLLGVHKHGVGRWTDILEDSEFHFNDRTAGDLKDRFRTCCPEELRNKKDKDKDKDKPPTHTAASEPKAKPVPGPLQIESILEPGEPPSIKPESPSDACPSGKPRKSRAHRKNMEDLAELGIHTPFKKSHRRERRPFSEQDDKEILEGFEKYGPQWTKIQRDPKFHLSNRQATDLRDRLRNKRPDLFNSAKTHLKDASKCGPLEPSVNMAVEHSLNMSRSSTSVGSLNHSNSREDMPKWPYQTGEQTSSGAMDWAETTHSLTQPPSMSSLNNDMGISRLLLDDSQVGNDAPNTYGADGASASASPASALPAPHALSRNDYTTDRRAFG